MDLNDLNQEQTDAVVTTEGFVRVIAGAGSGKTRALSYRFAYLVNDLGILPSHILCVTFTNKAANEMRTRIRLLTGDSDTGYISTFHGFCVSVLQEDSHAFGYPKSFLVLDNSDINAMLAIIYEERGLTLRQMTFGNARDMIEIRKLFKEPHYYTDMISMSLEEIHQKYLDAERPDDIIFYGYLYQEKKIFALDYNDLIKFSLYVFQTDEAIKLKWQERLEYIMIDEFQDIDEIQYELMQTLCGYHKNLFVVGDPDQTIYTWRGANVTYLLEFDKNFENVKTIMMNRNYRSTPEIINTANSLIDKNKTRIKKELIAMRGTETTANGAPYTDASAASMRCAATDAEDASGAASMRCAEDDASYAPAVGVSGAPSMHSRDDDTGAPSMHHNATDASLTSMHRGKTVYFHAKSSYEEAAYVADKIEALSACGVMAKDVAILFRAHYMSRVIEEVFQTRKIAYTLYSGVPFFDRTEIKDSLSYLRMIVYKDDLSFLRIVNSPKRNIGEKRIAFLKEAAEKNGTTLYECLTQTIDDEIFANTKARDFIALVEQYATLYRSKQISELFNHLIHDSGYENALRTEGNQERLDNLAELKQTIYEYETSCGEESTLENFLTHIALYTNADFGTTKNAIKMMTIHGAKGLEFPFVFIIGMNENMFPSKKIDSPEAMEEERRLAFVAYTRAMDQLYLTEAEGFVQSFGFRFPSRFIFDVDKKFLQYEVELSEDLIKKSRIYIEESCTILQKKKKFLAFAEGDKVLHKILGTGRITAIDEIKHLYTVQFDNMATPRQMSFKAPLERIAPTETP